MARSSDQSILEVAREHDEIIITHDLDYGQLLAFSGDTKPSVVIFRTDRSHSDDMLSSIQNLNDEVKASLEAGAIVIVEDSGLRLRRLPVTKNA